MKLSKSARTLCLIAICAFTATCVTAQNKYMKRVSDLPGVQYMYIDGATLPAGGVPGLDMSDDNTISSVEIINCDDNSQSERVLELIDPLINELPLMTKAKEMHVSVDLHGEKQHGRIKRMLLLVTTKNDAMQVIYITGDIDAETLKAIHDADIPK